MPILRHRTHAPRPARCYLFIWMLVVWMLLVLMLDVAQAQQDSNGSLYGQSVGGQSVNGQSQTESKPAPASPAPQANYSGMYSFLRDGEFVQITVEDQGRVIGFVSRYAEPNGEGGFFNHFFTAGKLEGNRLEFTTEAVNGVAFSFRGAIERGDGKTRGDEGYYVLHGNLIETTTDNRKKASSTSKPVALNSFPENATSSAPQK